MAEDPYLKQVGQSASSDLSTEGLKKKLSGYLETMKGWVMKPKKESK